MDAQGAAGTRRRGVLADLVRLRGQAAGEIEHPFDPSVHWPALQSLRPLAPACSTWLSVGNSDKTEAEFVAPVRRVVPVVDPRLAALAVVVPGAAPTHRAPPFLARQFLGGVGHLP